MVVSNTTTTTIKDLISRLGSNCPYGQAESITILSDFQRGNEETGVWSLQAKLKYIVSLMKRYPAGILTLVKGPETDPSCNSNWSVLDGGNRLRAIRDYMNNTFKNQEGKFFSELTPEESADFKVIMLPTQWLNIEQSDPPNTIAEMFCSLNTSAKPLSNGELFKAHGWKGNISEIELSKKLVGNVWKSAWNDQRLDIIRALWCDKFAPISENKRCGNLALAIGFVLSAKNSSFSQFDPKYCNINKFLSVADQYPTEEDLSSIYKKLTALIEILDKISTAKTLFGNNKGFPSKSKISPIWKPICENSLTPELQSNMIKFYNDHALNLDTMKEYNRLLTNGGDNHIAAGRVNAVHEYMNSFD